jgi:iron complex transport system substrate-binding protein
MPQGSLLKIASLLPSTTEIACALGLEKNLVGRSHECDFPPGIERLPICTAARLDSSLSSSEIDRQVKSILEQGISVYEVHAELLRSLKPDVILTQAQCEVCAVSLKDVEAAVCNWLGQQTRIISCSPMRLCDLWTDIRAVAGGCGVIERGEELITRLQMRMENVAVQSKLIAQKPRVACIEWIDPLMSAGNWVPELVEMAGGINLFGTAGEHSPWFSWEELMAADPDVLVILPCGFNLTRARFEMKVLVEHPNWRQLRAVQQGQVYLTDGNQYFNRPGPRLVESLEILTEILHPGIFRFGHQHQAWELLNQSAPASTLSCLYQSED